MVFVKPPLGGLLYNCCLWKKGHFIFFSPFLAFGALKKTNLSLKLRFFPNPGGAENPLKKTWWASCGGKRGGPFLFVSFFLPLKNLKNHFFFSFSKYWGAIKKTFYQGGWFIVFQKEGMFSKKSKKDFFFCEKKIKNDRNKGEDG